MAKPIGGLEQLLVEELQDLFDAEKQLVRALPKMAKEATDSELETALRNHLEVTRGQVQRLERIFESMDRRAKSKPCVGMKGIVEEGREAMEEEREESVLDSAIAAAARKVEHYEMMGYESARSIARQLGMREAADLLQQTLDEEVQADRELAQIAKRLVKESAAAPQTEPTGRASATRRNPRGSQRNAGGSAHPLTDHDQIRQWAEERGGQPACVKGTGGRGDTGMIRLDFPGYTGAESLEPISWDDWFEKFDENGLALLVQEKTGRGQKSNFNKLVSRETAEQRSKPRARAAR
jgi:ferritin-like metal-binding protein YciE